MARPLRLEFAGALYHVMSRGDRREDIFEVDEDRVSFLALLGDVCETYNWVCHAYCLMDNHYHLLIETPDANLSRGMRQLNGVYTQGFNQRHDRVGHVFQGRYKAIHVEKEAYLLEVARYIVLNPVAARMVRRPENWPWSSYRMTMSLEVTQPWLNTDWLLAAFGKRKSTAQGRYQKFVAEGKSKASPLEDVKNQVFLGTDEFVEGLVSKVSSDKELSEIPSSQRRTKPLLLSEYEAKSPSRDAAIVMAYGSGGYTQKEIGDYFGLHYSRVSRVLKKAKGKT